MKSVSNPFRKFFSYTYPSHNHLGVVFSGPLLVNQGNNNSLGLMISVKQFIISIIMKLIFMKTGENWCVIFEDKFLNTFMMKGLNNFVDSGNVKDCVFFINEFFEKQDFFLTKVGKSGKQLDYQILEEFKEELKNRQNTMEYFEEDDRVGFPWYWTIVTIIILIFLFVYSNN